ncbi:MAG: MerR family transcriptional regulator [Candidatus Cloacimonadota bacterium]|nr:MAG: MerR family transcriptional regulator [Candidatus Cloacimonadota bacterium]
MSDTKFYRIGEVAKKLGIHDQTIRMYERRSLFKPHRDEKGNRIFHDRDIIRLQIIITLTQELGLNLSGVKLAFALARRLKMSNDELLDFIDDHFSEFHI